MTLSGQTVERIRSPSMNLLIRTSTPLSQTIFAAWSAESAPTRTNRLPSFIHTYHNVHNYMDRLYANNSCKRSLDWGTEWYIRSTNYEAPLERILLTVFQNQYWWNGKINKKTHTRGPKCKKTTATKTINSLKWTWCCSVGMFSRSH